MRAPTALLVSMIAVQTLVAQTAAPAIESIRQADLKADLYFLGSDAMRGRLTNTTENLVASEWIKARFERLGLATPIPGYFQNYNLMTVTLGDGNAMDVRQAGQSTPVAHGEGFYTQRFSATAEATGPVVFAGYGITSRDPAHDDYRAADVVKGSIVLVIDHEPGERDPDEPLRRRRHVGCRRRAAQSAGRAGEGRGRDPVRLRRPQPSGRRPRRRWQFLAAAAVAARQLLTRGLVCRA